MIIKSIKLKNIRSYEDAEINFPQGSIVLAGDIGTGKTSVLLAIEFALFGLQPGQKGSALLRNGEKEGSVSLEIEIDNNAIVVERGLERKKSVNQSFAKIKTNGREEEISVTQLKNKVLQLLNYPKEFEKKTNLLYRFTVYTPQEEMRQIILESAETRLDTLRHIFGIDKYKRIRENTELFTAKLREDTRLYEGQISGLEDIKKKLAEKKANLFSLDEDITKLGKELQEKRKLKLEIKKSEEEVEEKIKEKEKYEQEIEKTKIMLLGKKELLININNEDKNLSKQVEEARKIKFEPELVRETEERIKGYEKILDEKERAKIEILSKIKSFSSKIQENSKFREQISLLKLCPTCFQDVSEDYKKNIVRRFEEDTQKYKKEILVFEKDKNDLDKEAKTFQEEVRNLQQSLAEFNLLKIKLENIKEKEERISELEKQKSSSENDILMLEKQIMILKESVSLLKKYELVYIQKGKELEEAEKAEREKEIELASKEKEKQLTIAGIEEINKEIIGKENLKKKLIKLTEFEDWLSSSFLALISFTERNIMLKLREDFSKLFNEWFNILVPEIFSVRLDEDFTPVIEQQDYSLDYSSLSGGERTAIALAYRLALNQVINSLLSRIKTRDLVILDEPTDGFSEQQLDKMRDVLQELKVKQLIIVSHESKIESFVENIIKFKKEAGVTKIEY